MKKSQTKKFVGQFLKLLESTKPLFFQNKKKIIEKQIIYKILYIQMGFWLIRIGFDLDVLLGNIDFLIIFYKKLLTL